MLGKLKGEDGTTTDLDLKYKLLIQDINKQTKDENQSEGSEGRSDSEGNDGDEDTAND